MEHSVFNGKLTDWEFGAFHTHPDVLEWLELGNAGEPFFVVNASGQSQLTRSATPTSFELLQASVPSPATLLLLAAGSVGMAFVRRLRSGHSSPTRAL